MTLSECELAFARAMLADPRDASRRLVYADWLEECGDAQAALVREAEGWEVRFAVFILRRDLRLYDDRGHLRLEVSPLRPGIKTGWAPDVIATVSLYHADGSPAICQSVRPDGSSWGCHNWAWLLSLALARGLVIPGLAGNRGNGPGPMTPIPED